eukprot:COSAG02_NODE_771_length_17362_cov_7.601286_12_plen_56_part_00
MALLYLHKKLVGSQANKVPGAQRDKPVSVSLAQLDAIYLSAVHCTGAKTSVAGLS